MLLCSGRLVALVSLDFYERENSLSSHFGASILSPIWPQPTFPSTPEKSLKWSACGLSSPRLIRGTVIHLGRTGNSLCPVAAILAYMARRGSEQGPLYIFRDGSTLSRRHLVSEVRSALSSCGLDCNMYAGHSFRIGAATTAAAKGVEDSTIRSLGRWRSDAYQLHIRLDSTALAQVTHTLAN